MRNRVIGDSSHFAYISSGSEELRTKTTACFIAIVTVVKRLKATLLQRQKNFKSLVRRAAESVFWVMGYLGYCEK